MIAQLTGIPSPLDDQRCVIDVAGVGYLVYCSSKTLSHLGSERITIFIETIMRQEQLVLYGFLNRSEQDVFNLLITVQGVGPRVGLAMLSALGPDDILSCLQAQDATALTRADGVGPKLAQRIVHELKGKAPKSTSSILSGQDKSRSLVRDEALSALINLGYRRLDAEEALTSVQDQNNQDLGVLITQALKILANKGGVYGK